MNSKTCQLVRLAGIVAVIGAVACAISDMLMLTATFNIADYPNLQPYLELLDDAEVMAAISHSRLAWGGMLGVLAFPFSIAGIWQVYQGLKPAGRWLALPPTLFLIYGSSLSPFVHGSFIYGGQCIHALNDVDTASQAIVADMFTRMTSILTASYAILAVCSLIGCIWFSVAVASRKTFFPRWMALGNPLLIWVGQELVSLILPKSITFYTAPAGFNIASAIFFALSTILLWRVDPELISPEERS